MEQQRVLEAQRAEQQRVLAQGSALQAYYEQIGKLLTEYDLRDAKREEIRELARGQTFTVLQGVDGNGKGNLLTFLHGAGLIGAENPAVALTGANFEGANLHKANLFGANLTEANLKEANLKEAYLQGANLSLANLEGAILYHSNLQGAYLRQAALQQAKLEEADLQGDIIEQANLQGANLQGANLQDALLWGANLQGANLQWAVDLTQARIEGALGNKDTRLPENRHPPAMWSKALEEQRRILHKRIWAEDPP